MVLLLQCPHFLTHSSVLHCVTVANDWFPFFGNSLLRLRNTYPSSGSIPTIVQLWLASLTTSKEGRLLMCLPPSLGCSQCLVFPCTFANRSQKKKKHSRSFSHISVFIFLVLLFWSFTAALVASVVVEGCRRASARLPWFLISNVKQDLRLRHVGFLSLSLFVVTSLCRTTFTVASVCAMYYRCFKW